ncbi:xenopsin peptides-like [Xenopus laevis]|uniref:Uncharacterized protein n=2 Tax=Xenopus laevis TaxID=8355 RepID=A0A974HE86_XENLA|nr:xenopsin peptides-like [Xenopus laevis]OCT74251.1 hypothetical protein XELAEV_18033209mg [Xenopus laevis]
MLKGIFLCALLVVLSANSMAQPTGSADPDAIVEREVREYVSRAMDAFRNGASVNKMRETRKSILLYPHLGPVHAKKVFPLKKQC